MALVLKDRVKESSVSTGTGSITLDGATGPFQSFSVIGDGNTTYYGIVGQTTNEWEVGIGTYTASGTTLSRDTILASSASGAAVNFSAGTKDVFVTYPSEKSVYLDALDESNEAVTIGTTPIKLGESETVLAGIESITLTQNPSTDLQVATKQYVDNLVASGIHFHEPVRVESPINLNATYNNGTSGVGATLTNAGTQVALVIDGITLSVADRVLVYEQTNQTQNGVYVVTDVGSGSTNWILTRSDDADTFGLTSADTLGEGSTFFVRQGDTGAGETYTCNTSGTITFGTTNITFAQISSAQIYSAGTGLSLAGTQFSITNTAVTPATKGTASKTVTATVNAQGQLTSLTDQDIAIQMSQVTSGVLGATQGGTGQSSYTIGDILYADTTTSLARLADVATGNALISGGLSAAPAWGKIALASAVSGTLPVANGGTGVTSSTGSGNVVLSTSPTLVTPILGIPQSGDFSSGTFTWPTFNQNTTGTASNVTGTVAIANGGTGETTRQAAMDALAGATTSGQYLRGNGTDVVMANIVAGDVPTLNQNTTGNAGSATVLQTARTIGGVSFNGSANINLPGVNTAGNQNTTGSAATLTTARTIGGVSFDGSANIDLPGVNIAGNQDTSGNAATATSATTASSANTANTLATPRTINNTSFDGSANITTARWGTGRNLWGTVIDGSANTLASLRPIAGNASVPAFSTNSDTNTGMFFPAADTIAFTEGGVERMRITSAGNVGINTSTPGSTLSVNGVASFSPGSAAAPSIAQAGDLNTGMFFPFADNIAFSTSGTERMRFNNSGDVFFVKTADVIATVGHSLMASGAVTHTRSGGIVMYINRNTDDGTLVEFRQANVTEGTISVSGTTVSYNGGHLSRWSQLYNETTQVEVYRGTVLESVDAMCEWYDDEGNLLSNEQATKTIISTTPASKAVAGVFDMYDNDDEDNPYDFYVAQSGDFVIRVAAGTVVQNGDLLESAGDGTARVQADDICRSSTIAKVTSNYVSETYADGSFCVPCILMIG